MAPHRCNWVRIDLGSALSSPHTSPPTLEDQRPQERDAEHGAGRYSVGVTPAVEPPAQLVLATAAGRAGSHPTPQRISRARERKADVAHVDAHRFGPGRSYLTTGDDEFGGTRELDDGDADRHHRIAHDPLNDGPDRHRQGLGLRHRHSEEAGHLGQERPELADVGWAAVQNGHRGRGTGSRMGDEVRGRKQWTTDFAYRVR